MQHINNLRQLFSEATGYEPETITELPSSGSNRRYFRLAASPEHVMDGAPQSLIGVSGTCKEENEAFLYLDRHFEEKGLPVPHVIAVSPDRMYYLQQDLGDMLLFNAIEKGRISRTFSESERKDLIRTIRLLPDVQFLGAIGLDFSKCYPAREFDVRSIMWDLNYFKYCFLKATGLEFQEDKLEDDFQSMAEVLMRSQSSTFMYRDFQSRNVMLGPEGKPYFIDFQGGRKGPIYYDVASFLWQAKANFTDPLREMLIEEYIDALRKYKPVDKQYFLEQLRHFVLFRILQVLGAYGFRGYFEKKPHFMQSVPYAIANLRHLLVQPYPEYPYLTKVLKELVSLKKFDEGPSRQLTVKVISFAYKNGIPNDPTGNGGGFVFDCRAVNNPGKYERFKPFTGLDREVIDFLEADGEITEFLKHTDALTDASVARYIERGFTHLMISFGCTGGQHRSVYSAQHTAEHIFSKFNVKVELIHREQNIEKTFLP